MKSKTERANAISGASALRSATVVARGTVAEDQDGATVMVRMEGDLQTLDGSGAIEMPSRVAGLMEGDDVAVTLRREPGRTSLVPEVTASYAASKRTEDGIEEAKEIPADTIREITQAVDDSVARVNKAVSDAQDAVDGFINDAGTTYVSKAESVDTESEWSRTFIGTYTNAARGDAALATKGNLTATANSVKADVRQDFADVGLTYTQGSGWEVTNGAIKSYADAKVENELGGYYTKSEVNQTVNGITSRVESAESTANGAVSTATEAKQTANGFSQRITAVENGQAEVSALYEKDLNGLRMGYADPGDSDFTGAYINLDIATPAVRIQKPSGYTTPTTLAMLSQDEAIIGGWDIKSTTNRELLFSPYPRPLGPAGDVEVRNFMISGDCDVVINDVSLRDLVLGIAYPVGSILFRQWGSQYDPANDGMPGTWRQVGMRLCSRTLWDGLDGYSADARNALTFSDTRATTGSANRLAELTQWNTTSSWPDWYLATHDLTSGSVEVIAVWKRVS